MARSRDRHRTDRQVSTFPETDDRRFLQDDSQGYKLDVRPESDVLLCTFAGIWTKEAIPGFQFVHVTDALNVSRAYFTDLDQAFYQNGIRGIGNQIDVVVAFLRDLRNELGVRRVVCTGNSMGGYAALLFGLLMGADEVHAFSPLTDLRDPTNSRNPDRIQKAQEHAVARGEFLDLAEILNRRADRLQTHLYVHYSWFSRLDRYHHHHIEDCPGTVSCPYPLFTHNLATALRERGSLERILEDACEEGFRPNRTVPMGEKLNVGFTSLYQKLLSP